MHNKQRIIIFIIGVVLLMISAVVYFGNKDSGFSTYHPEAQDLFRVEFEYPATWIWKRANQPIARYDDLLSTADPTKPDYGLNEEPNFEQGLIMVWVLQIKPMSSVASTFEEELLAKIPQNPYFELHIDEVIEVDGYSARRIVYRIAPRPGPMNQVPLLKESIFVTVGDRYYEFFLSIPESVHFLP